MRLTTRAYPSRKEHWHQVYVLNNLIKKLFQIEIVFFHTPALGGAEEVPSENSSIMFTYPYLDLPSLP